MSPPSSLAHYRLTCKLGAGGMGEVYRATDTKLGRDVALKVLPPEMAQNPDRLVRFQREARAVAALNHPHIVALYSVEECQGVHFLTMELVEGQPLDGVIPKDGFPVERILDMSLALAEALAAAHDKGLVHRDLKPANIMVTHDGHVKVLDFGLAKDVRTAAPTEATLTSAGQTQMGVVIGTPPYMSPEQISGRAVDYRSDIFSLGIILHEMTTGRRPFQGSTSGELAASILRDDSPPITRDDLPGELATLIQQCLAKDAGERIQSARLLAKGLQQARLQLSSGFASPKTALPSSAEGEGFWVAVLPFKYKGSNDDIEALAEGLSEEIVTGLSRFSYLRVIAHGATTRQARYVMEGSLRQAGVKLRVAVKLVDAATGAHLWAENYERNFSPETIFELQDELVPRIVSTVADMHGVLPRSISEALRSRDPEQLSPYEALMRSFGYGQRGTAAELAAALSGLELAVRKVPAYGDAWAMLAFLYVQDYAHGFNLQADSLSRGLAAAQRAVEAAPTNHLGYCALAQAHFFQKDIQSFRNAAERFVSLNSMDSNCMAFLGEMLVYAGDAERGLELAARAKQINPHHPGWYWYVDFYSAYRQGDYRGALNFALKVNLPGHWFNAASVAAACGQLGERDAATKAVRDLLQLRPDFAPAARRDITKWWEPAFVEGLIEGWRKAGLEIEGAPSAAAVSPSGEIRADEGFWVAVLPFKSTGTSAELMALAEGLSEEIVTGLSRFSYLRVIARGSTLKYAKQAADMRTIGKELGARYVMEGSLRQAGVKLRVAVQLVDAASGAQMWAETYERAFSAEAIFEVQDDLVPRIVSTVAAHDGVLPQSMAEGLRTKSEDQLSPHEATLRSFRFFRGFNPEEHAVVKRILESAVRTAPDHGDCWAMLSHMYSNEYWSGWNVQPDALDRALAAARRAVDVAPSDHLSHWALALALFLRRDLPAFRIAAERAIELNRMDGSTVAFMGHLIAYAGDWERGCAIAGPASALNPNHAGWHGLPAFYNAYRKAEYQEALAAALRLKMPGHFQDPAARAAAYAQLGQSELAHKAVRELLAIQPDFASMARGFYGKWHSSELIEHLIEGWRKAGLEIEGALSAAAVSPSGEIRADEGFWVAVLPFKSTGAGTELAALAEGLSEEIVTGLSRFSYLRVTARGSKSRQARYVIEGSLRQAGPTLRLAVQLVDTATGAHLWAETYNRPFQPEKVFTLQDDLAPRIVSTVADAYGILPHTMSQEVRSKVAARLTPYEALLRSFSYAERVTAEEHAQAKAALEHALLQTPGCADCWAMLSILLTDEYIHGFSGPPDPLGRALQAARRAVDTGSGNHKAHQALAWALFFRRQFQASRVAAERTIALNPMDASAAVYMGQTIAFAGDWERGCGLIAQAIDLNPNHPGWYWYAPLLDAYRKTDYRAALALALKISMPGFTLAEVALAAVYGQLGETESAHNAMHELLALKPDYASVARQELGKIWDVELVEHLIDGLRKAGLDIAGPTRPAG